jgi:HNH endonuclease
VSVELIFLGSPSDDERFWLDVGEPDENGCWPWQGRTNEHGYGVFSVNGRDVGAHRYAFGLGHRGIPKGKHIHHRCCCEPCVNWDHLEALTPSEHSHEIQFGDHALGRLAKGQRGQESRP